MNNKERFITLLKGIDREGIDEVLLWLENYGFYDSPASSKYHGSYPGGLLEHSLNVYEELLRLVKVYPEITANSDSIILCSLLHDVCKVGLYSVEKRNRKNESGKWESYDYYAIDEKFAYGGHGSKSVYIIQHFIKLTPEEAVAINCHMGAFDNSNVGNSYEQFPFAWMLHVADESATYIKEKG